MLLLADDVKRLKKIRNANDTRKLQVDIINMIAWCEKWPSNMIAWPSEWEFRRGFQR